MSLMYLSCYERNHHEVKEQGSSLKTITKAIKEIKTKKKRNIIAITYVFALLLRKEFTKKFTRKKEFTGIRCQSYENKQEKEFNVVMKDKATFYLFICYCVMVRIEYLNEIHADKKLHQLVTVTSLRKGLFRTVK